MTEQTEKILDYRTKVIAEKKCYCDVCKKLIFSKTITDDGSGYNCKRYVDRPYRVLFGHNEWGNDSIDSNEYNDVCSDDCLASLFIHYTDEYSKEYPSGYMEISPEYLGKDEYTEMNFKF